MKRSEMLQILDESLFKHMGHYGGSGVKRSEVYKVLDDLEKAGMLPPENGKEASYIVDYRFNCLKWDEE